MLGQTPRLVRRVQKRAETRLQNALKMLTWYLLRQAWVAVQVQARRRLLLIWPEKPGF